MGLILGLYIAGILVTFFFAMIWRDGAWYYDRHKGSRVAILSPLWPFLIIYWTIKGMVWLWKSAEWGKR